jgi:hypothetical protein
MVDSMVKWLSTNISYDFTFNHSRQDAMSVIRYKTALCEGYSNLMCAMLRSLGVAARKVDGYLTSMPVHYSIYGYQESNSSTAGGHSWVEVYYPPLHSWVSTEPQMDPNVIFGNYIVFNNGVQALVKQMNFFAVSQISSGSATFSVGSVTSDTVYSTNLSSTNAEPHTATTFNVAIALNVISGNKTPIPILKDTTKTICDNSTILPTFIVTNPQGTVTWIQNGQTTIGDTLTAAKPDSMAIISVYQSQTGCVSDTAKAILKVLKKPAAPVLNIVASFDELNQRGIYNKDFVVFDTCSFNTFKIFCNDSLYTEQIPLKDGIYKVISTDSLGCYTQTSNVVNVVLNLLAIESKNIISIFPNPSNGFITISGSSITTVEVYNVLGVLVQNVSWTTETQSIDLSHIASGIYHVVVRNKQGQWTNTVVKE